MFIVCIPAFNEEKIISKIVSECQKYCDLVMVCDDGSSDNTAFEAQSSGALVIQHSKNQGKGAALKTLFNSAKEKNPDVVVTIDGDGQFLPNEIPQLAQPVIDNLADLVIGNRYGAKSEMPKYRKFGNKILDDITNKASDLPFEDTQSGFRAYSKSVFSEINLSESGMGISTEILIKANQKKIKITEIPIKILYKGETSTHNPVSHGTSVMLSTMKFISIEHPLKFYGIPGVLFLITGLFFILWTIQEFTSSGRIITNVSLIGIGSTIFGMMLMMTSIMLFSLVSVVRERK